MVAYDKILSKSSFHLSKRASYGLQNVPTSSYKIFHLPEWGWFGRQNQIKILVMYVLIWQLQMTEWYDFIWQKVLTWPWLAGSVGYTYFTGKWHVISSSDFCNSSYATIAFWQTKLRDVFIFISQSHVVLSSITHRSDWRNKWLYRLQTARIAALTEKTMHFT